MYKSCKAWIHQRSFLLNNERITLKMKVLKEIIRFLLYILKRKSYSIRTFNGAVNTDIRQDSVHEYFYGYYDKSPERNGKVLFHEMVDRHVNIIVKNLSNGNETLIGNSLAFNWQMGSRSLWIDDEIISYNLFIPQL